MASEMILDMIGRVPREIRQDDHGTELIFNFEDGGAVRFHHYQDCCEDVRIEEIIGELDDLVGVPILSASEATNNETGEWGSSTWTFYLFRSEKGDVTVRWLGESNGYYSETVDMDTSEEWL